jgi:NAD(P)-dependent dehydrogenase (short-subunit alcohol dehydrogenase family)
MGTLDGRVAIITGSGRGIGREHALLFAAEGAKVVVNDLGAANDGSGADVSAAESVVNEIRAAGGEAVANTESVTSFDAAQRMVEQAVSAFGDLHIVVNNAGVLRDRMLPSMSEEEFDTVVAVNLKGTFNLTRHAAAYWRDQAKRGDAAVVRSIVNTASGAGLHGNPGQTNYAAAKAGVAAMTILNGLELKRYVVKANCIAPVARTRLTLATPGVNETMANPVFDPSHISPFVAYLASEGCKFNGQVFSVYGGGVGIYQGWSIHEEVALAGLEPAAVAEAVEALPSRVRVNSQMHRIAEAATG